MNGMQFPLFPGDVKPYKMLMLLIVWHFYMFLKSNYIVKYSKWAQTRYSFHEIEPSNSMTTVVHPLSHPSKTIRVRNLFSTQHSIGSIVYVYTTNNCYRSPNVTGRMHTNSSGFQIEKHDVRTTTVGYNHDNKVHTDVRYPVRNKLLRVMYYYYTRRCTSNNNFKRYTYDIVFWMPSVN